MPTISLLSDADEVVGSLTGIRRQIFDSLDEPASASTIAARLGTTRQRVNYHLKALQAVGLVELAEVRQRRGLQEQIMQRVADTVVVSPTVFADLDLSARETAGVAGVVATASDLIAHVASAANDASASQTKLATATVDTNVRLRSPSEMRRLVEDIGELIASYNSSSGVEFRFAGFAIPTVEETR